MSDLFPVRLPRTTIDLKLITAEENRAFHSKIAEIFLNLWAAIDSIDRKAIATYWKNRQGEFTPKIFFDDPRHGEHAWAAGYHHGETTIKCNLPLFRLFPNEVIECLLAHEMAHVRQSAIGKNRDDLTPKDLLGLTPLGIPIGLSPAGIVELHADETMIRWGFDRLTGLAWLARHRRPGEDTILSEPFCSEKTGLRFASLCRRDAYLG
jgi:hypothetical protein